MWPLVSKIRLPSGVGLRCGEQSAFRGRPGRDGLDGKNNLGTVETRGERTLPHDYLLRGPDRFGQHRSRRPDDGRFAQRGLGLQYDIIGRGRRPCRLRCAGQGGEECYDSGDGRQAVLAYFNAGGAVTLTLPETSGRWRLVLDTTRPEATATPYARTVEAPASSVLVFVPEPE